MLHISAMKLALIRTRPANTNQPKNLKTLLII